MTKATNHISSTVIRATIKFLLALCFYATSLPAFAACLGLGFPAPQNSNVCETLLEDLLIPRTQVFCDVPWYAPPHCHLPGACHADPLCKTFEVVEQIGSHIVHSGELYCELREIDPEEMIDKLAADLYTDTAKLTTGGLTSTLYQISAAHIDTLECDANKLNSTLNNILLAIVSSSERSVDNFFGGIDIDTVRIISRNNATAGLYLREGFLAITLDSVVVFQPELFEVIDNWNIPWTNVAFGGLSEAEHDGLLTMVHELIHVRQYRKVGREQFINLYLANAITTEYENLTTEREAQRLESIADNMINEIVAANLSAAISMIIIGG